MVLNESASAELACGHKEFNEELNSGWDDEQAVNAFQGDTDAVLAGLCYTPVTHLTIGLEAEWRDNSKDEGDQFDAAFVTRSRGPFFFRNIADDGLYRITIDVLRMLRQCVQ